MVLDSALTFLTFQVAVKVIRNFTQDSLEMCQIHSTTSKFHVGTLSRAGSPLWEKDTSGVGVLKFTVPSQCVTFSIPRHPKASQGIPRHPVRSCSSYGKQMEAGHCRTMALPRIRLLAALRHENLLRVRLWSWTRPWKMAVFSGWNDHGKSM